MTLATTFETLYRYEEVKDWPDSTVDIETAVRGELADRIRRRVGKDGDVVISEHGHDGGYSEYTPEWENDVEILVGGQKVWSVDMLSDHFDEKDTKRWSVLGCILDWLNEKPADDTPPEPNL